MKSYHAMQLAILSFIWSDVTKSPSAGLCLSIMGFIYLILTLIAPSE